MKQKLLYLAAVSILTSSLSFAQSTSSNNDVVSDNSVSIEEQMHRAEIVSKYARKQGVFLINGSLAALKNSSEAVYLNIDWGSVSDVQNSVIDERSTDEVTRSVSVADCEEEFDEKFISFFNEQNKKGGIQLTMDKDASCKYELQVLPLSFSYIQKQVIGSFTYVSLNGMIYLKDRETNAIVAELFFNTSQNYNAKFGKGAFARDIVVKCWHIEAQNIIKGFNKLVKKAK